MAVFLSLHRVIILTSVVCAIIICILGGYGIQKTNGNLISGFNFLSEEKKQELRETGIVKKHSDLCYMLAVPLLMYFVVQFFINDLKLLYDFYLGMWVIFAIILIAGLIIIKRETKE